MKKRGIFLFFLIVLLVSMSRLVSEAYTEITIGVITIWDDGSITPIEAPIQRNGNLFTLTDDIAGFGTWGIEILRSNTILDGNGHTLRSTEGYGMGIDIDGHYYLGVNNVTIRNLNLENWGYGVFIDYTSDNTVYDNNLTGNSHGVFLSESSNNRVFKNNITASTQSGISIIDSSNSNTVTENDLTNNRLGIWFGYSAYINNVTSNIFRNNYDGIYLMDASANKISRNNLTNIENDGIRIWGAFNNSISSNLFNNNTYGFEVGGYELNHFLHSIDTSNLVDGKPVHYLANQANLELTHTTYPQVGYLAFVNCTNVTVKGLNLSKNGQGLLIAYTHSASVTDNLIVDNNQGIRLYSSSHITISRNRIENNGYSGIILSISPENIISKNTITRSRYGIGFENSSANHIYHNNFFDNTNHTYDYALDDDFLMNTQSRFKSLISPFPVSINMWDNNYTSGGNYWHTYNGTDFYTGPFKNETGSDGIGDKSFSVYENNTDNYPLTGSYSSFNTSIREYVDVASNSTVEGFEYELTGTIRFYVSNTTENQTNGFCRVTIPHIVLPPSYNVTVGYEYVDYDIIFQNETHTIIYFSYPHSKLEVVIIPEFSPLIILPLLMIISILVVTIHKASKTLS